MVFVFTKEEFLHWLHRRGLTVLQVQEVATSAFIHHLIRQLLSYVNLKRMVSKNSPGVFKTFIILTGYANSHCKLF